MRLGPSTRSLQLLTLCASLEIARSVRGREAICDQVPSRIQENHRPLTLLSELVQLIWCTSASGWLQKTALARSVWFPVAKAAKTIRPISVA